MAKCYWTSISRSSTIAEQTFTPAIPGLEIDPHDIYKAKVLLTIMDGKVRHRDGIQVVVAKHLSFEKGLK